MKRKQYYRLGIVCMNYELKSFIHRFFIDQHEAARAFGMVDSRLSRIIRGCTKPTAKDVEVIAEVLAKKILNWQEDKSE